jgi:arylsulfatase A-like enzyme
VKDQLPANLDGGDFSPLLAGINQPVTRRDSALLFHFPHYQGDTPVSSIREGDLKFVLYYEDNTRLLFDLAKDPSERNNLVDSRKEDAARLEAKLRARLSEAGAKLPVASSTYKAGEEPARKGGGKGGQGGKNSK